jgi:predicted nucleic acid-binding protein
MSYIIDTSTLISLARINLLEIIRKLKLDLVLPDEVYNEAVIRGEEKGFTDATVIKSFIKKHKIKVLRVKSGHVTLLRKRINKVLTKGDEAVISIAITEKAKTIVTNDDGLGKIALALGFRVKASPDLLLRGLKENLMNFTEFEIYTRSLVVENRLSSVVAELYLLEGRRYVKD